MSPHQSCVAQCGFVFLSIVGYVDDVQSSFHLPWGNSLAPGNINFPRLLSPQCWGSLFKKVSWAAVGIPAEQDVGKEPLSINERSGTSQNSYCFLVPLGSTCILEDLWDFGESRTYVLYCGVQRALTPLTEQLKRSLLEETPTENSFSLAPCCRFTTKDSDWALSYLATA